MWNSGGVSRSWGTTLAVRCPQKFSMYQKQWSHWSFLLFPDVMDVSWSPHDVWLASCSVDNTIVIWNARKFPGRWHPPPSLRGPVQGSTPSSGRCFSCRKGVLIGSATLFFPEMVTCLRGHTGLVKGLTWDPVGKYIASQADDHSLRVWRTVDWQMEANITKPFSEVNKSTVALWVKVRFPLDKFCFTYEFQLNLSRVTGPGWTLISFCFCRSVAGQLMSCVCPGLQTVSTWCRLMPWTTLVPLRKSWREMAGRPTWTLWVTVKLLQWWWERFTFRSTEADIIQNLPVSESWSFYAEIQPKNLQEEAEKWRLPQTQLSLLLLRGGQQRPVAVCLGQSTHTIDFYFPPIRIPLW